ncbi:MAG: 30S ribosomal protein S5 [Candidatus Nezhaarchaeales archaeon]
MASRDLGLWEPRTQLGRLVKQGKVTSIDEVFALNLPIREVEIIDYLLPNLVHEVIDVGLVQTQTDAGEISRFRVVTVVGNGDGYVGLGSAKAKQMRNAIDKAVVNAKLNLIPVRRGCGSWECRCGQPHSIAFRVKGKAGSVRVTLMPAPKGTGLVGSEIVKSVLRRAGIRDVWTRAEGETRTLINTAKATYEALKQTYTVKLPSMRI